MGVLSNHESNQEIRKSPRCNNHALEQLQVDKNAADIHLRQQQEQQPHNQSSCSDQESLDGKHYSNHCRGRRKKKRNNDKGRENAEDAGSDLKEIGLWHGGSLVMNAIVGLGIFGTPKGVLMEVGSVGMTLIIWTMTGIFSMFAALCFVELRESVSREGVEYAYITEAFGPLAGFVYSWMRIAAAEPVSTALFAMVFTSYLTDSIYDECGPPHSLTLLIANLAILSMLLVNVLSIKISSRMQHLATLGKLAAISVIVVVGLNRIVNGKLEIIRQGMQGTKLSPVNLVFAFYNGLWAYGGWSQVNHVTSGIKKPPRNVPRVIKTVIPIVLLLYLTVVLSYFTAMTTKDLLSARAIGVTWANKVLGPARPIVSIGVCLAALGSLNATLLSAGRLSTVAAKNGQMPDVASWVHVRSKTPLLVVSLKAVVAMVVVCLATVQECLRFYIFCVWLFHGMSVLALLCLRFKNKSKPRPYKVDLWIPVVVVVLIACLLIVPFTQSPEREFIAVLVLIMLSLASYYPVTWMKSNDILYFPDTLTIWLQLFLRIAPRRELRRDKRRSMIRRYLALDRIIHPENANKPRPLIVNQFASLRLSRRFPNRVRAGNMATSTIGKRGTKKDNSTSAFHQRRGSSLRATDLKRLNSNHTQLQAQINQTKMQSPTIRLRGKRSNVQSNSFTNLPDTINLPSPPSLPILKNRFNVTPFATKDCKPGAMASPSDMLERRNSFHVAEHHRSQNKTFHPKSISIQTFASTQHSEIGNNSYIDDKNNSNENNQFLHSQTIRNKNKRRAQLSPLHDQIYQNLERTSSWNGDERLQYKPDGYRVNIEQHRKLRTNQATNRIVTSSSPEVPNTTIDIPAYPQNTASITSSDYDYDEGYDIDYDKKSITDEFMDNVAMSFDNHNKSNPGRVVFFNPVESRDDLESLIMISSSSGSFDDDDDDDDEDGDDDEEDGDEDDDDDDDDDVEDDDFDYDIDILSQTDSSTDLQMLASLFGTGSTYDSSDDDDNDIEIDDYDRQIIPVPYPRQGLYQNTDYLSYDYGECNSTQSNYITTYSNYVTSQSNIINPRLQNQFEIDRRPMPSKRLSLLKRHTQSEMDVIQRNTAPPINEELQQPIPPPRRRTRRREIQVSYV